MLNVHDLSSHGCKLSTPIEFDTKISDIYISNIQLDDQITTLAAYLNTRALPQQYTSSKWIQFACVALRYMLLHGQVCKRVIDNVLIYILLKMKDDKLFTSYTLDL
jgi:hypothetical protein